MLDIRTQQATGSQESRSSGGMLMWRERERARLHVGSGRDVMNKHVFCAAAGSVGDTGKPTCKWWNFTSFLATSGSKCRVHPPRPELRPCGLRHHHRESNAGPSAKPVNLHVSSFSCSFCASGHCHCVAFFCVVWEACLFCGTLLFRFLLPCGFLQTWTLLSTPWWNRFAWLLLQWAQENQPEDIAQRRMRCIPPSGLASE